MKIAVIGAGIFGTEISLKLSHDGYDLHLFEKKMKFCMAQQP